MLARLDGIPGVSRSRAECSGHSFRLELAEGAPEAVAARAAEVLGRGARVLAPGEAEVQHAARRRGEPWLAAEEARSLSYVESRVVAARVSAAVGAAAGLGREERERLAEAVREEMFDHVERLHAGLASPGRFFEDWPELAARAGRRCARWLEGERLAKVEAGLRDHFSGAPAGT